MSTNQLNQPKPHIDKGFLPVFLAKQKVRTPFAITYQWVALRDHAAVSILGILSGLYVHWLNYGLAIGAMHPAQNQRLFEDLMKMGIAGIHWTPARRDQPTAPGQLTKRGWKGWKGREGKIYITVARRGRVVLNDRESLEH